MKIPLVDLYAQYKTIKKEVDDAIQAVIKDSAYIKGKYVEKFENEFANSLRVKHCVGVANGTDALFIALKSLGIGKGDEVITVANSWISTSETISQAGAKPVFVDIEENYFTINPLLIEKNITKNTKAIIPVNLYGQPADIKAIKRICRKHKLILLEDCAQAHYATLNNKYVGTFGITGTFSFYPGKNLGAYGDAGALITNNDKLAKSMRMFANHGALIKHQHSIEGINSRLDGIQAAILTVKLNHIKRWTNDRIKRAAYYNRKLSNIPQITIPKVRPKAKHVYHLYVILAENRDELREYLSEHDVATGVHYPTPLPFLKAYKKYRYKRGDFPIASKYQSKLLSLPLYPELSIKEIDFIVSKIKNFYGHKK
jgi:dTDP-4-amino-4,6-dideoxygalactose transaminase